jgi:hypothetical protein
MDEESRLSDLEQNKRDHKVEITDVAISKVPYVKYRSIPESHYAVLQELAKEVLRVSRDENDCNEVAITYNLDSPELAIKGGKFIAVVKGDEHSVDPLASTDANHISVSARGCVVVITHNHPSLSKISLEDAFYLLIHEAIRMIVAVTNRGSISYLVKTDDYNHLESRKLLREAIRLDKEAKNLKQKQDACDYFLNNCFKTGLIFEDH